MNGTRPTQKPEKNYVKSFCFELLRTPASFMPLDVADIHAELERRWDEKNGIMTLHEMLSDQDGKGNGLMHCGQTRRGTAT